MLQKIIREDYIKVPHIGEVIEPRSFLESISNPLNEFIYLENSNSRPGMSFCRRYSVPGIPGGKLEITEVNQRRKTPFIEQVFASFFYLEGALRTNLGEIDYVRKVIEKTGLVRDYKKG